MGKLFPSANSTDKRKRQKARANAVSAFTLAFCFAFVRVAERRKGFPEAGGRADRTAREYNGFSGRMVLVNKRGLVRGAIFGGYYDLQK